MTLPETHLTVKPEWIDHNGHMNVAFYVLAFDQATDQVYETWGLGLDYPDREQHSIFTIGMNVDYHNEAFQDDPLSVKTQLVDMDCKRIHYVHSMYHTTGKQLLARNECLCMNIDLATRHSAPFPPSVMSLLNPVMTRHRKLAPPGNLGRILQIRKKSAAAH